MIVRKANISRVLNQYISKGLTDTQELAELTGKSRRIIQAYLDLNDDREFKASDIASLARHFARLGHLELSYRFLTEDYQIDNLCVGKATGDVKTIVSRMVEVGSLISTSNGDPIKLRDTIEQIQSITADLKAEYAHLKSRLQERS